MWRAVTITTQGTPLVSATDVTFQLSDPDDALRGVKLHQEIQRPRVGPGFTKLPGTDLWHLRFPRPATDRMEYKLELERPEGGSEVICDPANPKRAPGPFGDRSVIEWPDYRPPRWLDDAAEPHGVVVEREIRSRIMKRSVRVHVWSSDGAHRGEELPLLVAHDGSDYANYSGLLLLLGALVSRGELPPLRAALVDPVERDHMYSASTPYARAFAHEILPQLATLAPTQHGRGMRIGMGASLGALAMLHVHRSHPATFGALFLQSGSFFRQRFDGQESGFVRFRRISRHVGQVLCAEDWAHPIRIAMTCGAVEENLRNNRAMCAALAGQGYDVSLLENRDAHNWIGWRDAFDPALIDLLRQQWGRPARREQPGTTPSAHPPETSG
ncbi:MAG: alpha/beta hydrolase [Actinomycetota bacterium]